jgi:hypothetical protein
LLRRRARSEHGEKNDQRRHQSDEKLCAWHYQSLFRVRSRDTADV